MLFRSGRDSVPSPFPYAEHMRVVALESEGDLIGETAAVLAELALRLGGRTLGLFTSLRRMHEVAGLLAPRLRAAGLEVLAPRRASDDPRALVSRFSLGGAVLLGARRFWQGLDLPGRVLQAVVIEKLPFEVPSELRRRREERLRARGEDAFGRYALGKMLLNLKHGYLARADYSRAMAAVERLLLIWPDDSSEIRDRGLLRAHLGEPGAAIADLQAYLDREPKAADAASVKGRLARLRKLLPELN